jgi:hypothetical protein
VAISARGRRSRTIVALLVATAVTLITLDFRGFGPLESAQQAVRGVLEPVAGVATSATRPITRVWNGIADYGRVEAENKELRAEVDRLRATEVDEANARQQLDAILASTPSWPSRRSSRRPASRRCWHGWWPVPPPTSRTPSASTRAATTASPPT